MSLLRLLLIAAMLAVNTSAAHALTPTPIPHSSNFSLSKRSFVFTYNGASISSGAVADWTIPLDGCQPGDVVTVFRPAEWTDGAFIINAQCITNNSVDVYVQNLTGGAFDPNNLEYSGVWEDRTSPQFIETPLQAAQSTGTPTQTATRTPTPTNTPTRTPTRTPTNTP